MNYITEFKQLPIKNIQPSPNHLEDDYSNEDIKRSNIFSRLFKSLNYLVWGDV